MSKIEMLKDLPDGGVAGKVQSAVELSNLIGQLGQDMASLTEETRRTLVQGQMAADRIERTIFKAEALLQRLESWVPPQPQAVIHEAPIWPMLVTAAVLGMTLAVCVTLLVEWRISPLLHAQQHSQIQVTQSPQPPQPQKTGPQKR